MNRRSPSPRTTRTSIALLALLAGAAPTIAPTTADAQRRGRPRRPRRPRRQEPPPPPAPEPVASPTASAPSEPAPSSEPAETTPPPPVERPVAIDVSLGPQLYIRHLSFSSDASGAFAPYDLDAAPALGGQLQWYPGAHFTANALAHIGIVGEAQAALGVSSQDASGTRRFGTSGFGYSIGARARIPVARSEVGITAGYAHDGFSVTSSDPAMPSGVPEVRYSAVRFGLDGRIALGDRVAILARAGYRLVLAGGEIHTTYFPRGGAHGVDAQLGLSIALALGFELRATFEGRWYLHSLNTQTGDANVGSSALDQFYTGTLWVAFRR